MLRNRPSRVPLGMADVKHMEQRLRLRQASHPLVAQTDRTHVPHQQPNIHLPQPHYNLREGPQRSRDASVVQLDPNRHVPQIAVHDSVDSTQDSDSDETTSATIESVARLVHIAEVSPTITQVPGYDPPAPVDLSSERLPVYDSHNPGVISGHHQDPSSSSAPTRSRYNGRSIFRPNTRSGYSYHQPSHQDTNHPYQRNSNHSTALLSQRGHNPHAVSFAPRVRFGSALQDLSPHHSSNIVSLGRRGGTLRARRSSSRISNPSRGETNHQTRSRPMPRSRGPVTRGPRRTGARLRPPAASSIDTVMDRYPIFPSTSAQSDPSSSDYLFFPHSESIPQRRGILTPPANLIVTHMPYPRSRLSSSAESYTPGRSRASSNSLPATNMIPALEDSSRPGSIGFGSETWHELQSPRLGSVHSSRVGSSTLMLLGSNLSYFDGGLPPTHSPLDRLTQELQRLSTGLSSRSRSSLGCSSRLTSTDEHLLSGDVFYSDNDGGETEERDAGIRERERRHGFSHLNGHSMDRRGGEFFRQPQRLQRDLGIAARIVDVEVDCQSAAVRPLLSPSAQSVSSNSRIDTSIVDSSPPANLPDLPPVTPGRPQIRSARTPSTSCSNTRPQATPRIKVYDDGQPASVQPQTPADLHRHFRMATVSANPVVYQIGRPLARVQTVEQSPLIPTRNAQRNTYPSFQQANSEPATSNSHTPSPYSPNLDLRTAAAITAVERRRTARAISNENVIDPITNGMEAEREALLRRREDGGTNILDDTPPHQGRCERFIS